MTFRIQAQYYSTDWTSTNCDIDDISSLGVSRRVLIVNKFSEKTNHSYAKYLNENYACL